MINARIQQVMESTHTLKHLNISEVLKLMPRSEFVTLHTVAKLSKNQTDGRVYSSDIAGELCISGPAVSRSLNRLEDKGFIKRNIGKNDRRNIFIELTASGKAALKEDWEKYADFMEATLSYLSEDEMEEFTRLCKKIADGMKTEVDKRKKGD